MSPLFPINFPSFPPHPHVPFPYSSSFPHPCISASYLFLFIFRHFPFISLHVPHPPSFPLHLPLPPLHFPFISLHFPFMIPSCSLSFLLCFRFMSLHFPSFPGWLANEEARIWHKYSQETSRERAGSKGDTPLPIFVNAVGPDMKPQLQLQTC